MILKIIQKAVLLIGELLITNDTLPALPSARFTPNGLGVVVGSVMLDTSSTNRISKFVLQ